jgi:hypothetical protein
MIREKMGLTTFVQSILLDSWLEVVLVVTHNAETLDIYILDRIFRHCSGPADDNYYLKSPNFIALNTPNSREEKSAHVIFMWRFIHLACIRRAGNNHVLKKYRKFPIGAC